MLVVGLASGLRGTGQSGEPSPDSHKRVFSTIRHAIATQPSKGLSTSYPHASNSRVASRDRNQNPTSVLIWRLQPRFISTVTSAHCFERDSTMVRFRRPSNKKPTITPTSIRSLPLLVNLVHRLTNARSRVRRTEHVFEFPQFPLSTCFHLGTL